MITIEEKEFLEFKMELANCLHTMLDLFLQLADDKLMIEEFCKAKEIAHRLIADFGKEEDPNQSHCKMAQDYIERIHTPDNGKEKT